VARFGRIDTLVNNAGIFIAKPFTHYTEVDDAAGVNLAGFFHITQLAIAEMEKQGCPRRAGHDEPDRPRNRRRAVREIDLRRP
jgi:NAD(P)-dependent dehydrogenase (short-subunit alcohol dehydrogenase family)